MDNNNNLVFSGFKKRGWDLYLINSLDQSEKKEIKPTQFYSNKNRNSDFEDLRNFSNKTVSTAAEDYTQYIFARNYQYRNSKKEDYEEVEVDSLRFQDDYIARKYQTEFSVDYISTTATIDNLFGTRGVANLSWSDVMGDHRINVGTNLVFDLNNSDLVVQYAYLKNRVIYDDEDFLI